MSEPKLERRPRDFESKRALKVLKEIRKIFRDEKTRSLTVDDVAEIRGTTVRATRDWLNYLHEIGELFIESWRETTALRGKKLPAYRMKRTGKEQDAQKWWLDGADSEGGDCD